MIQKFWDSAMALTSNDEEEDSQRLDMCTDVSGKNYFHTFKGLTHY